MTDEEFWRLAMRVTALDHIVRLALADMYGELPDGVARLTRLRDAINDGLSGMMPIGSPMSLDALKTLRAFAADAADKTLDGVEQAVRDA